MNFASWPGLAYLLAAEQTGMFARVADKRTQKTMVIARLDKNAKPRSKVCRRKANTHTHTCTHDDDQCEARETSLQGRELISTQRKEIGIILPVPAESTGCFRSAWSDQIMLAIMNAR